MPTTDQQRHQMIERAVRRQPGEQAEASVAMWLSLGAELRAILGDRGFEALYTRSLHDVTEAFPWITRPLRHTAGDAFELVDFSLDTRDADQAHAASAALLNVFIDTLIALIGEHLTNNILRKAWGDNVVNYAGTEHHP